MVAEVKFDGIKSVSFFVIATLSLLPHFVFGQNLDTSEYRQVHYIQSDIANDLFTVLYKSDKYYTDGMHLVWSDDLFKNRISKAALVGFRKTTLVDYSLAVEQNMFTPENTQTTEVDTSDRPYAGQLFFTYAKVSNRFWKGQKLKSQLFLGVQGPASFAEETQNGVHSAIGNDSVNGWSNQLSNGLILDYQIDYMGMIPLSTSFTELNYFGAIRAGTLNIFGDIGFRFKIGRYTDSYVNDFGLYNSKNRHKISAKEIENMSNARRKIIPKKVRAKSFEEQADYLSKKLNRRFQCYFFVEGLATYYARNGSVEGSLIQFQSNKYEYSYDDYKHGYLGGRYGFVVQYANFHFEYLRLLHTDIYRESGYFGYGRVVLLWSF